jgi:cellulose synthase (UDP-forming)
MIPHELPPVQTATSEIVSYYEEAALGQVDEIDEIINRLQGEQVIYELTDNDTDEIDELVRRIQGDLIAFDPELLIELSKYAV